MRRFIDGRKNKIYNWHDETTMIGEDEYFVFLKDDYKARSRITYNFKTTIENFFIFRSYLEIF
jgi:uncharacterized protein YvpB